MRALALSLAAAITLAAATFAHAELAQQGNLRVAFAGKLSPHRLPRIGTAPVSVSLSGAISTANGAAPPQLRRITMAINRFGRLDHRGLPACHYHQIQPASSAEARASCRRSLIGTGTFKANVALPEQSPFPSDGKVLAFNGTLHGHPVIFAHIYGTEPLPISRLLPFRVTRIKGTFRTVLSAKLPAVAADWGYVSALSLNLHRRYQYRGHARSYLSAGCPAPQGVNAAIFSFARASFSFEGGRTLRSVLTRTCRVRRG